MALDFECAGAVASSWWMLAALRSWEKNARVVLYMNEYIFIPHSISAQAKNRNQLAKSPFESRYEPGSFSYQMANPLAE